MAISALPYMVQYIWRDREGTKAFTNVNIQNRPVLAADVQAKAASLATLLKAVSSSHMIGYRIISRYEDPAVVGAGEAERKGKFTFTTAQGRTYTTMVPGFKDSLVDTNNRIITVGTGANATVAAFTSAIVNGPLGMWGTGMVNEAGQSIVAVISGKKVHVRSLKQRASRSG
jgi:hypothetical protein